MSVITKFRQFRSHPLPQRYTHNSDDTTEYLQPQPKLGLGIVGNYLTFWMGNQLPGQTIHTQNPHETWVSVKDKRQRDQNSPYGALRKAGSFNVNLSQQTSEQIMAQWRAAWQQQAAQSRR